MYIYKQGSIIYISTCNTWFSNGYAPDFDIVKLKLKGKYLIKTTEGY